ncbi:MAG: NHLP leader peptide family RiPP precursor [Rivularia sp. (in: Bacteria)]|nr:NHLP leader peptide family RiPP precursor [Rivularia sp. MS3]
MILNNKNRRRFEELLITKAFQDISFRRELIENPKMAIAEYFGVQLPVDIEIKVLQEDKKVLYVVLPYL